MSPKPFLKNFSKEKNELYLSKYYNTTMICAYIIGFYDNEPSKIVPGKKSLTYSLCLGMHPEQYRGKLFEVDVEKIFEKNKQTQSQKLALPKSWNLALQRGPGIQDLDRCAKMWIF